MIELVIPIEKTDIDEIKEAVKQWEDFTQPRQVNVILTDPRRRDLGILIALGKLIIQQATPPEPIPYAVKSTKRAVSQKAPSQKSSKKPTPK